MSRCCRENTLIDIWRWNMRAISKCFQCSINYNSLNTGTSATFYYMSQPKHCSLRICQVSTVFVQYCCISCCNNRENTILSPATYKVQSVIRFCKPKKIAQLKFIVIYIMLFTLIRWICLRNQAFYDFRYSNKIFWNFKSLYYCKRHNITDDEFEVRHFLLFVKDELHFAPRRRREIKLYSPCFYSN